MEIRHEAGLPNHRPTAAMDLVATARLRNLEPGLLEWTFQLEGARKWIVFGGVYSVGFFVGVLAEGLVDWNALLRL